MTDIHICGDCRTPFFEIAQFVSHKQQKCSVDIVTRSEIDPVSTTTVEDSDALLAASSKPDSTETVTHVDTSNSEYRTNPDSDAIEVLSAPEPAGSLPTTTVASIVTSTTKTIIPRSQTKKYKCSHVNCTFTSAYPKDLRRHSRVHTGERPYECTVCSKRFNRSDKFKIHERLHSGLKPYKCEECNYAASDGSSLKKHSRIHSDERPYKCQICPYASRNSSQLVVHLRTHTGDSPFECPHCESKFKINSDLKRHIRLHTGEKPYKCERCDYSCAIKGNLNTHVRLNHSNDPIRCDVCDFVSPSKRSLRKHAKTHVVKKVQCPQSGCTYSCSSQALLRNHTWIHSERQPLKCNFCAYTSRHPVNIRCHVRKRHLEEQLETKDQLKKPSGRRLRTSKSASNTKTNKNGQTTCDKTFKCHLCDAAFVREDSLRSHVRQHKSQTVHVDRTDAEPDSASSLETVTAAPKEVVVVADEVQETELEMICLQPVEPTSPTTSATQFVCQLQPGFQLFPCRSLPPGTVQYIIQQPASDHESIQPTLYNATTSECRIQVGVPQYTVLAQQPQPQVPNYILNETPLLSQPRLF